MKRRSICLRCGKSRLCGFGKGTNLVGIYRRSMETHFISGRHCSSCLKDIQEFIVNPNQKFTKKQGE